MKQKGKNFIISFLINGLIYGILMYFIGSVNSVEQFLFSVSIFGLFMAIFNVFIFPSVNNKIKKNESKKRPTRS